LEYARALSPSLILIALGNLAPPKLRGVTMEKYILDDENLTLYHEVLSATTEEEQRKALIDLIRDEVERNSGQKALIGF
jgi:hypothetical protein